MLVSLCPKMGFKIRFGLGDPCEKKNAKIILLINLADSSVVLTEYKCQY